MSATYPWIWTVFEVDKPSGQQTRQWLVPRVQLGAVYRLPSLTRIVHRLVLLLFQPRWSQRRWRSTT